MRDRVETAGGTVTARRVEDATVVEVSLPIAVAAVAS
jgi:signal transduction histidine kinase